MSKPVYDQKRARCSEHGARWNIWEVYCSMCRIRDLKNERDSALEEIGLLQGVISCLREELESFKGVRELWDESSEEPDYMF